MLKAASCLKDFLRTVREEFNGKEDQIADWLGITCKRDLLTLVSEKEDLSDLRGNLKVLHINQLFKRIAEEQANVIPSCKCCKANAADSDSDGEASTGSASVVSLQSTISAATSSAPTLALEPPELGTERNGEVLAGTVAENRLCLLAFRFAVDDCDAPCEIEGLRPLSPPVRPKNRLTISENGYRPKKPSNRDDELTRSVKDLLNKISERNEQVIVERMAELALNGADELQLVIQIIFRTALDEPFYCKVYVSMIEKLKSRYPEFPPEAEGENPITFMRVLLRTCQVEYEALPATLDPPENRENMMQEEVDDFRKRMKDKALANMKFIGNLYLRGLLAAKVISTISHDLLSSDENLPKEYKVECACALLTHVGYTLENGPHGKNRMESLMARLLDLKRVQVNARPLLTRRVQFQIQDLLDLRASGWKGAEEKT